MRARHHAETSEAYQAFSGPHTSLIMSQRGRQFFEQYVREQLLHPVLRGLGLQSHVHNLLHEARSAGITKAAIEEEVGPILQALWVAKNKAEMPDLFPFKDRDADGSAKV